MKISKYIHSCILLEDSGEQLLFDPGMFSFMDPSITPELFKDVKTIVITHNHPDHIDADAIKKIVELSSVTIVSTPEIKKVLMDAGIPESNIITEHVHDTGTFLIEAIPASHEAILADSLPENYGYRINNRILHPGDSFAPSLYAEGPTEILLLPITAPWTTELGVFEFAKAVQPKKVIPIHDGYAKEFFQSSRYKNFDKYFTPLGMEFVSLQNPGDSAEM